MNLADNFETLISPDNRECLLKYTGKEKDVVIPEGIHEIIDTAFAGSRDIRSVELPSSMVALRRGAFKDCDLLTKINIPEGLKIIEERIFSDAARIQGKSIKFGSKLVLVSMGGRPYPDPSIVFSPFYEVEEYIIDEENKDYISIDGIIFIKNDIYLKFKSGDVLMAYPQGKKNSVYNVPMGTKVIHDYAFLKNKHIEKIVIPESVEEIGEGAFSECENLKEIELYSSQVKWGDFVFSKVKNVVIRVMTSSIKKAEFGNNVSIYSEVLPLSKYPDLQRMNAIIEFGNNYKKHEEISKERATIFLNYLKKQKTKLSDEVLTEPIKRFLKENT